MADIQLNKPLYKQEDDKNFTPPTPRGPKANVLARIAALFLDIVTLHLLCVGIIKLMPAEIVGLGWFGPWLGLTLGFVYFTIGFSHITLGRTLGKLVLRIQVCDIAGPDLPVSRAAARAALLFWPFVVKLCLSTVAEIVSANDPFSIIGMLDFFGTMLIVGWVLGNFLFALLEPYNRTVYDRLVRSVIINAEIEAEPMAAHLKEVRLANESPARSISVRLFLGSLAVALAVAAAIFLNQQKQVKSLDPSLRDEAKAIQIPGFSRSLIGQPSQPSTTETLTQAFTFRKRGRIDTDELKADPRTSAALESLVDSFSGPELTRKIQEQLAMENSTRARNGEPPMLPPSKIRVELSYSEYADLFLAGEYIPAYMLSRELDLPTSGTDLATTETITSGTITSTDSTSNTQIAETASTATK